MAISRSLQFAPLEPGGSLLAYCGHYALPEIADLMRPHLRWHWLLGCYHEEGNRARLPGIGVFVTWKPILWLTKGPAKQRDDLMADMVVRHAPDKSAHEWSQSLVDAEYYIDHLSVPGELIIDPMVGGGTTVLAARNLGRRIIACDTDEQAIARASARLERESDG